MNVILNAMKIATAFIFCLLFGTVLATSHGIRVVGPDAVSVPALSVDALSPGVLEQQDCPSHLGQMECGNVSGSCTHHFSDVALKPFSSTEPRQVVLPSITCLHCLVLVHDLLRPPRRIL